MSIMRESIFSYYYEQSVNWDFHIMIEKAWIKIPMSMYELRFSHHYWENMKRDSRRPSMRKRELRFPCQNVKWGSRIIEKAWIKILMSTCELRFPIIVEKVWKEIFAGQVWESVNWDSHTVKKMWKNILADQVWESVNWDSHIIEKV